VGGESDLDEAERACPGVRITVEPRLLRSLSPLNDARALVSLTRLMRREHYDVVVTLQSKAGILARTAAKRAGVPKIVHMLTMANFGPGFSPAASLVYRTAERIVGGWTDAYFCVGEDLRDRYLHAAIASPESYHIARSAVRLESFESAAGLDRRDARRALGLPADERPLIAYVGSLDARKGVMALPELLARTSEHLPAAPRLVVAGAGDLRNALENAFAERGQSRDVTLLGHTDRVPEVMAAADSLVLLSRAEGIPQVLVQAAAAQTPFVSYPVDGAKELLARGVTGVVVPMGDVTAAAKAVAGQVNAPRPGRVDLGEWQRDRVERRFLTAFESIAGPLPIGQRDQLAA
jgi:glycosyltransferase involved in cell wall biosynthesis